jgi:WD40 repeat protein
MSHDISDEPSNAEVSGNSLGLYNLESKIEVTRRLLGNGSPGTAALTESMAAIMNEPGFTMAHLAALLSGKRHIVPDILDALHDALGLYKYLPDPTIWLKDIDVFRKKLRRALDGGLQEIGVQVLETVGRPQQGMGNHTRPITRIRWSPNGSFLATSSSDGTVRLWMRNRGGWRPWYVFRALNSWEGGPADISMLSWSNDSRKVAFCPDYENLFIYDVETGEIVQEMEMESDANWFVQAIEWAPAGSRIATARSDGEIRVYDGDTGAQVASRACRGVSSFTDLSWSRDGSLLAASSYDLAVHLWSVIPDLNDRLLAGPTTAVMCVDRSHPRWIAAGTQGGQVYVWDARSGLIEKTLNGHDGAVSGVSWYGDLLISMDSLVLLCHKILTGDTDAARLKCCC